MDKQSKESQRYYKLSLEASKCKERERQKVMMQALYQGIRNITTLLSGEPGEDGLNFVLPKG